MVAPSVPEELPQAKHSARSLSSDLGDSKPSQPKRKRTLNTKAIAQADLLAVSEDKEQKDLGDTKEVKRQKKRTLNADKHNSDRPAPVPVGRRDRQHQPKNLGDAKADQNAENRTLKLNDLIQAAYQLPRSDVQALADALQGMLEAWEVTEELRGQTEDQVLEMRTLKQSKSASMRGHFELKMINGCGPYAYLRWWSGGKHRSSYLGKARPET